MEEEEDMQTYSKIQNRYWIFLCFMTGGICVILLADLKHVRNQYLPFVIVFAHLWAEHQS